MKQQEPVASSSFAAQIALFAPYCGGLQQEESLLRVFPMLGQGRFEGVRSLTDGEVRRFQLRWQAVRAPLMPCSCELDVDGQPGLHYVFEVPCHQLVSWLMPVASDGSDQDLPDSFWSWLLLEQDAA